MQLPAHLQSWAKGAEIATDMFSLCQMHPHRDRARQQLQARDFSHRFGGRRWLPDLFGQLFSGFETGIAFRRDGDRFSGAIALRVDWSQGRRKFVSRPATRRRKPSLSRRRLESALVASRLCRPKPRRRPTWI